MGNHICQTVLPQEPGLQCELTLGTPESFSAEAMLATAMRIVNAIPALCAAPPGLVSSLDLPLTLPQHAFEARNTA
jgi:hypothetical protein